MSPREEVNLPGLSVPMSVLCPPPTLPCLPGESSPPPSAVAPGQSALKGAWRIEHQGLLPATKNETKEGRADADEGG